LGAFWAKAEEAARMQAMARVRRMEGGSEEKDSATAAST